MEAVGQLAGGIAHDFNNLLTAIAGYSRIARRRIGLGPGGSELTELERASERAVQLTRQLLAFSRRQLLEPVPVDLNEVTSALMPMLTRLIGEDIEIATLAGDDLPAVLVDRGQIEQVIVNLAINARDAMPGGGTITIGTQPVILDRRYAAEHPGVEPGLYVCLSVTDTGVGIDKETQAHIFEPFFTTKEVGLGTGLGLATVHGIVTQSNGHAAVYSELGLGATFKIYLPAAGEDAELPAGGPEPWPEELHGTGTILVCEDDELVRTFIEALLAEHGYRVLSASGAPEALRLVAAHEGEIDVLVTDIVMPLVSGPELAASVGESQPNVRLVFLSGYTAEAVRDRGDLPPGSAFLEKPFDDISFLRIVGGLAAGAGPQPPALREDEV
jgi:CheY-like chemotaxis protein